MTKWPASLPLLGLLLVFTSTLPAQSPSVAGQLERANKQTLPYAMRLIEDQVGAKVVIEVDAASFGDDEKAWSNLALIANRVAGALNEVGKDQVGKDAIAKNVQKAVIVKLGPGVSEDSAVLKDGLLTVRTTASDTAMPLLQNVIVAALEKIQ